MPLRLVRFGLLLIALSLLGHLSTGSAESVTPLTGSKGGKDKLLLFTVATNAEHDGLRRLRQSAEHYGHQLHILGIGGEWRFWGSKLKLIHRELTADYVAQHGGGATVLLFVDAYDVLVDGGEEEILRRFNEHFVSNGARIVFGAEEFCVQKVSLCGQYPELDTRISQKWVTGLIHLRPDLAPKTPCRYLNSGLYIGFAEDLLRLWDEFVPTMDDEREDDQVFYARLYVNEEIRVP